MIRKGVGNGSPARVILMLAALALAPGVGYGYTSTLVQDHYRWRADDGNEAAATWKADADTAVTNVAYGQNVRLRFSVSNTSSYSGALAPQLFYATSTNGPWTAVSTDPADPVACFAMAASTHFVNGALTTPQLAGSGGFIAGAMVAYPTNAGPSVTIGASQYSNFEYCFRPTPNAEGSATYWFKVSGMTTYSLHPALTMEALTHGTPPVIVSPLTASVPVGQLFNYSILASGSKPVAFGVTGLPTGLTFDGASSIKGPPITPGSCPVQLTAVNAWGGATQTLALTVLEVAAPSNQLYWAQQPGLTASDSANYTYYGYSVSLSGNRVAVGAYYANASKGAVYIYDWDGEVWAQSARLTASDGTTSDSFARSVSLSGDRLLVGAQGKTIGTNSYQGAAYVYDWNGTSWVQKARLAASDGLPSQYFGSSVSVSGNRALVGAYRANSTQGAAYVYEWNGTNWIQSAKLAASDGAASDSFGYAVSVNGNRALVGAYAKTISANSYQGAAYVYDWVSGTNWTQTARLTASDGAASAYFGYSVSANGNRALVGAYAANGSKGAAYVYDWSGSAWVQTARLTALDGVSGNNFGSSVSLGSDRAVVGAYGANTAYIFDRNGPAWTQTSRLTASDGASGDYFGYSVSISGDRAAVGAYYKASASGEVYVYDLSSQFNTAPVANNQDLEVIAGATQVPVALSFTDPDPGQTRTFKLVMAPAHGSIGYFSGSGVTTLPPGTWINKGTWFYRPSGTGTGTDTFYWQMCDGVSTSWVACVTVNTRAASAPNAPPEFKAGSLLMDGTNTLRVYRRVISGKFDFAWRYSTSPARLTASPEVVDWNNDGLPDLLVGEARGRIALFINQGTRGNPVFNGYRELTYQDGSVIDMNVGCSCFGGASPCVVPRVVDWNADGKKDLVVGIWGGRGRTYGNLWVFRNIGNDEAPVFSSGDAPGASGEGVSGSGPGGRVDYPFMPASTTFSADGPTSMPFITDLNNDGIPDLISGRNNVWYTTSGMYGGVGAPCGTINLFLGTQVDHSEPASFVGGSSSGVYPTMTITGACPVQSRKSVVAVDWTGSGRKDLLIGMQDGTVWFAANVGTAEIPVFTNCTRLSAGGVPVVVGDAARIGQDPGYVNAPSDRHNSDALVAGNEARLAVGDLDGDGLPDLVVGNADGYVTWFPQVNPRPVGIDQRVQVVPGHAKSIQLTARVDTGHSVTFGVLAQPSHGTLSGAAPDLVYTPDPGYRGEDQFTFRADDGALAGLPGTIFVTVKDHAPVAQDQATVLAITGRARTLTLTATDAGSEPLAYSIVSPPAHGTYILNSNVVTYTSVADYAGPDSFSWKANDGYLDSVVRTVNLDVTVVAVNFQTTNAPVAAGYLVDSGSLFDAGRGYGWTRADYMGGWMNGSHMGPYPRSLGACTDPRIDSFVYSYTNATWACSLPNGDYYVTLGYGNYSQGGGEFQDTIAVQGTTVVDTPYNGWSRPVFAEVGGVPATVTDGQLTITIGGVSNTAVTRLDYVEIRKAAPDLSSAVTFVKEDSATQGAWVGVYGADGYAIPGCVLSVPSYAAFEHSSAYTVVRGDPSLEARALQRPWSGDRILSDWETWGGAVDLDVDIRDGGVHRVAVYAWGNTTTQRVDVLDARDRTVVLDSRQAVFANGNYLVWDVKGHVIIRMNAGVVSGVFFGAGSASGAALDSNSDGLPDWWQIRHFGSTLTPAALAGADPDGDGLENRFEYLAGTDPNDPDSRLEIRSILGEGHGVGLGFDTVVGLLYDVYWKPDLADASHWQYYTSVAGSGGPAHVAFTNDAPRGFFQVKIVP